jgi:general secretion pathway protein C
MRAPAVRSLSWSDRIAALTPRERVLLMVGAGALLLFLIWLLFLRDSGDEGSVELAASPPAPAILAPAPVEPAPLPPPAMPVISAPSVAPATVSAFVLQGVSGGGPGGGAALIQYQNGAQRLVRVGREIVPGMTLTGVDLNWAIASSGGGNVRLDLNRPGATPVAAAGAPAPASAPAQSDRRETTDLRLGLQPLAGRRGGYLVKSGVDLPRLAQAGIQPGDIITRVNGSALDEERLLELSWEMSNAEQTEFEVLRNGRPMKMTLAPGSIR